MFGRSLNLFTVRGIPVRVHPSLLLFLLLAGVLFSPGAGLAGFVTTLLFLGMVFAFVLLHELGHAVVAQNFGVPVRSITLHPLGGVASLARMPREPRQELLIALAGPAVNFVLAAAFVVLHAILPLELLVTAIAINLALGLFNLLPAFPLDGGRVLRSILARRRAYLDATRLAVRVGQITAITMGLAGLLLGHLMLIFIAVFVFFAARAELFAVEHTTPAGGPFGFARRVDPRRPYPRTVVADWDGPPYPTRHDGR